MPHIRVATAADTDALLRVERQAFGGDAEADLVVALMAGEAYVPDLNLVAEDNGEIVGHVLFTRADASDVSAALLAPLAVAPERQNSGIGSALASAGLKAAREGGFGLSLVLGHPAFYPRFGYVPAIPLGIEPPYPVDPPEAWMVLELVPGAAGRARGVVRVADELMDPVMWRE